MAYLLLGLAALVGLLMVGHALSNMNPARLARLIRVAGGVLGAGLALVLLARGALAYAIPVGSLALWMLLQAIDRTPARGGRAGPGDGRTSRVVTQTLEMVLDLDTGDIAGRVLKGRFAGRDVETMTPAELAALWSECQFADPQSAQIVEAYLDQRHPNWREDMAREDGARGGGRPGEGRGPEAPGTMTVAEAYQILGLSKGATRADVTAAHKALILKYHPDRGGSDYFAAKLNEAKAVLLRHLD